VAELAAQARQDSKVLEHSHSPAEEEWLIQMLNMVEAAKRLARLGLGGVGRPLVDLRRR